MPRSKRTKLEKDCIRLFFFKTLHDLHTASQAPEILEHYGNLEELGPEKVYEIIESLFDEGTFFIKANSITDFIVCGVIEEELMVLYDSHKENKSEETESNPETDLQGDAAC
jgi:DNA-directed RNA polymerase subunit F